MQVIVSGLLRLLQCRHETSHWRHSLAMHELEFNRSWHDHEAKGSLTPKGSVTGGIKAGGLKPHASSPHLVFIITL